MTAFGKRVILSLWFLTATSSAVWCQGNCPAPGYAQWSNQTSSSITLTWTAVSGATNGYSIYYKLNDPNSNPQWSQRTTPTNSITLTNLAAGIQYVYQLRAHCSGSGNSSAYSKHGYFELTNSCTKPSGVSIPSPGNNSATVSWSASNATDYQVRLNVKNSATYSYYNSTTTSRNITGLSSNTIYEVAVRARCSGTWTSYSSSKQFTTTGTGLSAPTGLRYWSIGSTSAVFDWQEVPNAGGYTIYYRVYGSGSSYTPKLVSVYANGGFSHPRINLSSNATYEWYVIARNGPTNSPNSATKIFSTSNPCSLPSPDIEVNGGAVEGKPTHFNDNNGWRATSFNWSFPNGTPPTGNTRTPSTTFSTLGQQTITLTTANDCGTSDPTSSIITVAPDKTANTQSESDALQKTSKKNRTGDPIDPITGQLYHSEQDLLINGINGPYLFERLYFSDYDNYVGPFGANWTHNYNITLTKSGNTLTMRYPSGATASFHEYTDGSVIALSHATQDTIYRGTYDSYILQKRDVSLTKYVFDSNRQLQHILDKNGNAISFTFNGSLLSKITFPGGRHIDLTYSGSKISQIQDNASRSVTYQYSGDDLTQSTSVLGGLTQYAYANHRMISLTTPEGHRAFLNTYDGQGRVGIQTDIYNQTFQFAYYTDSTIITNPNGHTSTQRYDDNYRLVSNTDEEGHTTQIHFGNRFNQVRYLENAHGDSTEFRYHSTRYHLKDVITSEGTYGFYKAANSNHEPTLTQDALSGNYTYYTWTDDKLVKIQAPDNRETSFSHNLYGQITSITNPRGFETTMLHDTTGDLQRIVSPQGTDSLVYDVIGNVVAIINKLGQRTDLQYNAIGRVTRADFHSGDVLRIYYDLHGNDTLTVYNTDSVQKQYDKRDRLVKVIDQAGLVTRYTWTGWDQLDSVIYPDGTYAHYEYFKNGWLKQAITSQGSRTYERNPLGLPTKITDALGNATEMTYDKTGHLVTIKTPEGETYTILYNARKDVIGHVNAKNDTTLYGIGNGQEHKQTTDPIGRSTGVQYDGNYNITQVTNARNQVTKYTLDEADRVVKVKYPSGDSLTTEYNALNQPTRTTQADGSYADIIYNRRNEDSVITYSNGTVYKYFQNADGELTEAIRNTDTVKYEWNDYGIAKTTDGFGYQLNYLYNQFGQEIGIIYPSGDTVKKTYQNGLLNTVTDWLGNKVTLHRNAESWVTKRVYSNGLEVDITYDQNGRVIKYQNTVKGQIISDSLTLDAMGNIVQNVSRKPLRPYYKDMVRAYKPGVNDQYQTTDSVTYQTNKNGAVTARYAKNDSLAITYLEDDMVSAIRLNGKNILQYHNAVRAVVKRRINGTEYRYAREQVTPYHTLFETRDSTNKVLTCYIHIGVGPAWEIDAQGRTRFYVYNYQGNTVGMVDETNKLTDSIGMDIWGNFMVHDGRSRPLFGFQGMYGTEDLGDHLNVTPYRLYNAKEGRFLSRDPLAGSLSNTQSLNPYTYALNNPGVYGDPLGLSSKVYWMFTPDQGSTNDYPNFPWYDELDNGHDHIGFTLDLIDLVDNQATGFESLYKVSRNRLDRIGSNDKVYFQNKNNKVFYGNSSVSTQALSKTSGKIFKKVTGPIGNVLEVSDFVHAYDSDGGQIGYNVESKTGEFIGSEVGFWAGTYSGVLAASAIGGPPGLIVGVGIVVTMAILGGEAGKIIIDYKYDLR